MHHHLIAALTCPLCRDDRDLIVDVAREEAGRITEGSLQCASCSKIYPIQGGVPRFPIRTTGCSSVMRHFSRQWRLRHEGHFEKETLYLSRPEASMAAVERNIGPFFQRSGFARVLDAGCGSGDKTVCLARNHPQHHVIGMDYNESLALTTARFSEIPNLDFVNADLNLPPFKRACIDLLYSFGVLHHTENTARAFRGLSPLLAARGVFYTFIYPALDECGPWWEQYYAIRDRFFLRMGHLLPEPIRLVLLKYLMLLRFSRHADEEAASYQLTRSEYMKAMLFMHYDNVSPRYQHRHARKEVIDWYQQEGFEEMVTLQPGLYYGYKSARFV